MSGAWSPDTLLRAVRGRLRGGLSEDDPPMHAMLEGDDIVVTFRWPRDQQLYGIRFHTSESPEGPSTGEICESPDEWAIEVGWVLDEEVGTGLVEWGHRTVRSDGVVELDYRQGARGTLGPTNALPPLPQGHHYRVVVNPDAGDRPSA